jgi:hypothetical protein
MRRVVAKVGTCRCRSKPLGEDREVDTNGSCTEPSRIIYGQRVVRSREAPSRVGVRRSIRGCERAKITSQPAPRLGRARGVAAVDPAVAGRSLGEHVALGLAPLALFNVLMPCLETLPLWRIGMSFRMSALTCLPGRSTRSSLIQSTVTLIRRHTRQERPSRAFPTVRARHWRAAHTACCQREC